MPSELPKSLDAVSQTLKRRFDLSQLVITELRAFDGMPMNIDIPPNYSMQDAQAVMPIFQKIGFRVELRFVNNGRPYYRFFEE